MKKIVYGNSNFRKIKINNDYFYIDKTQYIETLEKLNEDFLIFLRPRRFGKSLFLSTLQYYYDENFANEFEAIFHDTYIGKNPTTMKNSYRILFFDFSGINFDRGADEVYEHFSFKVKIAIREYLDRYGYSKIDIDRLDSINNPSSLVEYLFEVARDDKIYLLIDEYDYFINAILEYSMQDFLQIINKSGFIRSFYEVLKTATYLGVVEKMFITGVTPISLDSLSSGFNIISHITYREEFNGLAGFTENEVMESLEASIFQRCKNIDKNQLLDKLKTWYNGYLFNSKANEKIYNATLINYFISEYNFDDCTIPINMLDNNIASDYRAIMKLFDIGDREENSQILQKLIEGNVIIGAIKDRYDPNQEFSQDDLITLLYYMGFITIKQKLFGGAFEFEIPNYAIKILYFNYFAKELEKRYSLEVSANIGEILINLALGDLEQLKDRLNRVVETLSNRDHYGFDEKHFQSIVLSLFSFAEFYFIESQPEKNRKYPDILLIGRDDRVPNNYMFELKWAKSKDKYNTIKNQGIKEVKEYLELDKIKAIPKLRSFVLIGSKDGVEFVEV